jgi:predicted transposase/invertase (TIGR01784 family)
LFSVAEIAKFTPIEADEYEESLMVYRDLKNSIDTAREDGKFEGASDKAIMVAETMQKNGQTDEKIALYTGLSLQEVKTLRKTN